jgi:hypothetical protein
VLKAFNQDVQHLYPGSWTLNLIGLSTTPRLYKKERDQAKLPTPLPDAAKRRTTNYGTPHLVQTMTTNARQIGGSVRVLPDLAYHSA